MMYYVRRAALTGLLATLGLVSLPARTEAALFDFSCVTNNSATNCLNGGSQLQMFVNDPAGDNNVEFEFRNVGPQAMSITQIYFDEPPEGAGDVLGWPLYFPTLTDSGSGVNFSTSYPGPNNPPGVVGFVASNAVGATAPVQPNGINPGEWLKINFTLGLFASYDNVVTLLNEGILRVAIHVQGFSNGGSESFLAGPGGDGGAPVPEPATLMLLGSGLAAAAGYSRRRRARKA